MKLLLLSIVCCLTGCAGLEVVGEFFGISTPEGDSTPAGALFGTVGPMLPGGLGIALVAVAKMAHTALRAKRALFESTDDVVAGDNVLKDALNVAQKQHHDSKLLEKEYDKYKNGGIVKKTLRKIEAIIT